MDPVHGSQSSFGSTDVTLTAQRGAVLLSSYGSESMGEVSMGTASTALKRVNETSPWTPLGSLSQGRPPRLPGPAGPKDHFPSRVSLVCPGPSPPSREFSGSGQMPAIRQAPPPLQGSGNEAGPAGPIEHFPSGYLSPARGPALPLWS